MKWLKVWILTPVLLVLGLGINEILLYKAKHQPSITSNEDLFCDSYSRVKKMGPGDVVLLGASRMQTNFDLGVFNLKFPGRQVVLLAQSGKGTAYPVLKDIAKNTNFEGIIIIDETEQTLISEDYDQQDFINYCHGSFSLNRRLNYQISALLTNRFIFLNPESNSLRLWGNLFTKQKLPEPFYTKTLPSREQMNDYARANKKFLKQIYEDRLQGVKNQTNQPFMDSSEWLKQAAHWQEPVGIIQRRGGQVIFVRMPVSQERWKLERKVTPPEKYWSLFVERLNVDSIHFANYKDLSDFQLPDTSHLDMKDKSLFTSSLLNHLQDKIR